MRTDLRAPVGPNRMLNTVEKCARARSESFPVPVLQPASTVHDLARQEHPKEHQPPQMADFRVSERAPVNDLDVLAEQMMNHSECCDQKERCQEGIKGLSRMQLRPTNSKKYNVQGSKEMKQNSIELTCC